MRTLVGDRRGLSLVELIVVLAIAGLVGGAIGATLVRQQRFYRGATELLYARQGVRDALEVLSTDIRGMSPADTVRIFADSAIELFATIGTSVVCQGMANDVGLPAARASGNSLSAFLIEPDSGDLALFHTYSADSGEHWQRYRISSFAPRSLASTCPVASRMSQGSDFVAGATGFVLTLATPLRSGVRPGAAVRFVRRGRYSLYRASDGEWYLGYRRCNAVGPSVCGAVQPVSGPYRRYSANRAATGLLFEYFDVAGRRLDPGSPLAIARVDVTARTESGQLLSTRAQSGRISDSATVSIAIRNMVHAR